MLHLPVRGSVDGGSYTTVDDMSVFWDALTSGRIVPERWVAEMRLPRRAPRGDRLGYGLGLWLHASGVLELHGYDAGVSFRTMHDPATSSTWTVGSNESGGTHAIEALLVCIARFGLTKTTLDDVAREGRDRGHLHAAVRRGEALGGIGGDIIGGVQDWRQMFTRPVARWNPYTTPAPDLFLLAAQKLGVAPGTCLVFEDGHNGLRAAEAVRRHRAPHP